MSTVGKTIRCRAAVCWAPQQPLSIEEITVDPPQEGEVRVRMVSASVCRTDFYVLRGDNIHGFYEGVYPVVPGHEGAGVVESVGPGVTGLQAGDHVVPSFGRQCNECALCKSEGTNLCMQSDGRCAMLDGTTRLKVKGQTLYQLVSLGTCAEYTVFGETSVAKVRADVPLAHLSPLGCCIGTGLGAALNEAAVTAGSTCAVFGLGGVGLAVVLGCRLAGATTIVGVDINPKKEAVARKFGCTDFVNPKDLDKPITQALAERFNGGFDFTFEVTGNVQVMRDAFECCRIGGGRCVLLGGAPEGKEVSLNPSDLLFGRRLSGCLFGGYRFRNDLPALADQVAEGKVPLDDFITHTFKLDQINEAFDSLRNSGDCIRGAIQF